MFRPTTIGAVLFTLAAALPAPAATEPEAQVPYAEHAAAVDALLDMLRDLDPTLGSDEALDILATLHDQPEQLGGPDATGYSPHRRWRRGNAPHGFGIDQFNQPDAGVYRARAATRIPNGGLLVVGDSTNLSNTTHVALVHYNSHGQRVAWPNVQNDYALAGGQVARFPGTSSWGNSRSIHSVQDVVVSQSRIYVLATQLHNSQRRPLILAFNFLGAFLASYSSEPDTETIRDAVAMDLQNNELIVLGRRSTSVTSEAGGFWVTRWGISTTNGLLSQGPVTTWLPGRRIPADIRFRRKNPDSVDGAYYVAYTFNTGSTSTTPRYPCIMRILANDQPDASFAPSGVRCFIGWDGGNNVDRAVALHNHAVPLGPTTSERLYLAVDVDRDLADGIGLVKLVDDQLDTSFGPLGRRIYGGCAGFVGPQPIGEGCGFLPMSTHNHHVGAGRGLHADEGGVYLTGYLFRTPSSGPTVRRPILLHVDAANGNLQSLQAIGEFPDSRFTALVPRPGGSELSLAGWASDEDTTTGTGPKRVLTTHLVRNSDLIFYDGLQTDPPL